MLQKPTTPSFVSQNLQIQRRLRKQSQESILNVKKEEEKGLDETNFFPVEEHNENIKRHESLQ